MQYSLNQLRETVGLSVETYRHWKRVLPPLAEKGGRAPCFSIGDFVAASILHRLTENAGVRVGHLVDISTEVFRICNASPWASLIGRTLTVDLEGRTCVVEPAASIEGANLALFCRIDPVLAQLRGTLLRDRPDEAQAILLLPPVGVPAARRRRRA
ncbi:MAG: hypothetical protein ACREDL_10455 [Bradyrhizobium sp.]